MTKLTCDSNTGCCLIGNNDWTFAMPVMPSIDGITEILIFAKKTEFDKYKYEHNLKFISFVQGTFSIYNYDCAFHNLTEEDVIETLNGRYGVYQGYKTVVFVKWE